MSPLDYVYLAIIIVCLLLSASFSASDMVYSCVSQSRLEKDKSKASKKALKLAKNYDDTIATILFGNDFSSSYLHAHKQGTFGRLSSSLIANEPPSSP